MRLLDAVAAALPTGPGAGVAAREVHDRVGRFNRTTIRHALRRLVATGRAGFSGGDRHRRYHGTGDAQGPRQSPAAPMEQAPRKRWRPGARRDSWRDYALRGDGSVRIPDAAAWAALMRGRGLRYDDVSAAELANEEQMRGWTWRKPTSAQLTRLVFGDPAPGRRRPR